MYRYFVYGAGKVGVAAICDLILNCEGHVLVYEPSHEVSKDAMQRLYQILGGKARQDMSFVGPDHDGFLKNVDVIISCAPYAANEEITKKAIKYRIPMVDLGGNPDMVAIQEHMADKAMSLVVPECGISPGISNMLAVYMAKKGYPNIEVRCGGIPEYPEKGANSLNYKFVFSVDGLLSEYSGKVPTINHGRLQMVDARFMVEGFQDLEASPTSNNSPQVVQNLIDLGVKNYNYMTLRYPGHWAAWRELEESHNGDPVTLRQDLMSREDMVYDREFDTDKLILSVVGTKGDSMLKTKLAMEMRVLSNWHTKISAMEMTTAWGATIVAHYIAYNKSEFIIDRKYGFMTPEMLVPEKWLLRELDKRIAQQ
jgi:saccharopine dehydrogenase-like NADP-dependent oxidoreductase